MTAKGITTLALTSALALGTSAYAEQASHVIHISVDGCNPTYLQALIDLGSLPNFQRFQNEGLWTNNARTDYDYTITLPNHTTQVTGRPVVSGASAHTWTDNGDPPAYPAPNSTLALKKGSYIASAFDVAHDNGLRTGLFTTKSKFSLWTTSWNATNGAPDLTGASNGQNKIDYANTGEQTSISIVTDFINQTTNVGAFNYAFLHFREPDSAGHTYGWNSQQWKDTFTVVNGLDTQLARIFNLIATTPALTNDTVVILTADHGGFGTDHSTASLAADYTIPFYVWGAGVPHGDLYAYNALSRTNPGTGRPTYTDPNQPIRNGDAANLEMEILGFGAVPGSTINSNQSLNVPEPASLVLLGLSSVALLYRRRRSA